MRERLCHEIDLLNLIEEIEDLSNSERRGLVSQLTRLLIHLIKWQYQPQCRSDIAKGKRQKQKLCRAKGAAVPGVLTKLRITVVGSTRLPMPVLKLT